MSGADVSTTPTPRAIPLQSLREVAEHWQRLGLLEVSFVELARLADAAGASTTPTPPPAVTHLLHLEIQGGHGVKMWLTCEDPSHAHCKTWPDDFPPEDDADLIDECFMVPWFEDCGEDCLGGEWPSEPRFPLPVRHEGYGCEGSIVFDAEARGVLLVAPHPPAEPSYYERPVMFDDEPVEPLRKLIVETPEIREMLDAAKGLHALRDAPLHVYEEAHRRFIRAGLAAGRFVGVEPPHEEPKNAAGVEP